MGRSRHQRVRVRSVVLGVVIAMLMAAVAPIATGRTAGAAETPDFNLIVSPSSQQFQPGGTVSFAIQLAKVGEFDADVQLSVAGVPAGVDASFSPNPVRPPGTSFLTLTAQANAALGGFDLTITGEGGGITHVATGHATLDFGLVPVCYGRVHGVVTDQATHLPIPEALVNGVYTDAQGEYTIESIGLGQNNSPTSYAVSVSKDPPSFDHVGQYWSNGSPSEVVICDDPATAVHETTEIDVALTPVFPASLTGKVVEGTPDPSDYSHVIPTTTPIDGASLLLGTCAPSCAFDPFSKPGGFSPPWYTPPFSLIASTVTAADGGYAVDKFQVGPENEPVMGNLIVNASCPGVNYPDGRATCAYPDSLWPYRHGYWQPTFGFHIMDELGSQIEIGPDQVVTNQDIALVKQCTASLSGHVTYPNGDPAADFVVLGSSSPGSTGWGGDGEWARTDAQGAFSFPELLLGFNNEPVPFSAWAREIVKTCGSGCSVDHAAAS